MNYNVLLFAYFVMKSLKRVEDITQKKQQQDRFFFVYFFIKRKGA